MSGYTVRPSRLATLAPQDEDQFEFVASVEILILRRREAASKDVDFGPGVNP